MLQPVPFAILWVFLVLLGALGVGDVAIRVLVGRRETGYRPGLVDLLHAQLLGLALVASSLVILGALGGWRPVLFRWGVPALGGLGLWRVGRWVRRREPPSERRGRDLWPLALGTMFFLSFLPFAVAPLLHHDDRVYHLDLPVRYLEAGGFYPRPFDLYANMPHLTEVLYVPLVAGGDLTAPKLFMLGISAWILVGLYAVGRSWGGPLLGGIAVLLHLSGKNVQSHLGSAYVEPALAVFLLGAWMAGRRAVEERSVGWAAVAGFEMGFAAASKYTAWPFVTLVLGWVLVEWTRRRGALGWKVPLALGGPVLLSLSPWLVKNYVYTGNPVYPSLYASLGGAGWSEVQSRHARLANLSAGPGPERDALDLLTLPFDLTIRDNYFNAPSFSVGLMILLLVSVALALFGRSRESSVPVLGAAGVVAWAVLFTQGRYLAAWLPILVVAALVPLREIASRRALLHGLAGCLVVLAGVQIVSQRYPWNPPWWALGPDRAAGLEAHPEWEMIRHLEESVAPDAGVLAMWENRFLFLDRRVEMDSVYQAPTGLARLRRSGDPLGFAEELRRRGISHVVVHVPQMNRYVENRYGWDLVRPGLYPRDRFEADRRLLRRWLGDVLVPERAVGPWAIFRLPTPEGGG